MKNAEWQKPRLQAKTDTQERQEPPEDIYAKSCASCDDWKQISAQTPRSGYHGSVSRGEFVPIERIRITEKPSKIRDGIAWGHENDESAIN